MNLNWIRTQYIFLFWWHLCQHNYFHGKYFRWGRIPIHHKSASTASRYSFSFISLMTLTSQLILTGTTPWLIHLKRTCLQWKIGETWKDACKTYCVKIWQVPQKKGTQPVIKHYTSEQKLIFGVPKNFNVNGLLVVSICITILMKPTGGIRAVRWPVNKDHFFVSHSCIRQIRLYFMVVRVIVWRVEVYFGFEEHF